MERVVGNFTLQISQGLPGEFAYVAVQPHGNTIIPSSQLAKGLATADGIYIGRGMPKGGIATADCMPLIVFGEHEVLLLHISRKTMVAGILKEAKKFMPKAPITAVYIGPHICPNHLLYETQGPDIVQFAELFPTAVQKNGSWSLSLRKAISGFLDELDIAPAAIVEDGRCTFEDKSLLSYRRALVEEDRVEERRIITSVEPLYTLE